MRLQKSAAEALALFGLCSVAAGEFRLYIEHGPAYTTPTQTGQVYLPVGRDAPFTNEWSPISDLIPSTESDILAVKRGTNNVSLPSRAWEFSKIGEPSLTEDTPHQGSSILNA